MQYLLFLQISNIVSVSSWSYILSYVTTNSILNLLKKTGFRLLSELYSFL